MNRFDSLLSKYRRNECSPEELEELMSYFEDESHVFGLKEAIERQFTQNNQVEEDLEKETELIFENILEKISDKKERRTISLYRWLSAAAILLFCGGLGYKLIHYEKPTKINQITKTKILPAENRAVLSLANGKSVVLTNAPNGKLAQQGQSEIKKTKNGQIVYARASVKAPGANESIGMNTLTTPRGGTFDIVLADGTHVWLNAGSSLTYPVAFNGEQRIVNLTGEAYFEVAHNGTPFIVVSNGQAVHVLGTHFNIEAYSDESIKTTLLQGSVRVVYDRSETLISPGQMAVNDLSGTLHVTRANIDEVMAWRNGLFIFDNESIAEIMRKAARWYDVEIKYQNEMPKRKLWGTVSRYRNINELMDNIALAANIKYKIEGRRVILMK
jgi:ferric-dicitrate binding protein FerR (iron transport regulator)